MHSSRSAEIAATVADPSPVLQLIVVSAVEILQGAAGVIALVEEHVDLQVRDRERLGAGERRYDLGVQAPPQQPAQMNQRSNA